ncbi:hypothetical protein PYW08_006664 [Mythimna loreyi]|uniref:Uncharacterized protein n=1 Tax=Mythimna loreyi TaxID=667449 RepID=A0ACC2RA41_9NEOP|nr:hypothetical protein PYW08_006664 [Mythimna loreyi]
MDTPFTNTQPHQIGHKNIRRNNPMQALKGLVNLEFIFNTVETSLSNNIFISLLKEQFRPRQKQSYFSAQGILKRSLHSKYLIFKTTTYFTTFRVLRYAKHIIIINNFVMKTNHSNTVFIRQNRQTWLIGQGAKLN